MTRLRPSSIGLALGLVGPVVGTGCVADPGEPTLTEFIAFQSDFEGFSRWDHESLGFAEDSPGHPGGQRTVFINQPLPLVDEGFPVGTILVKTMETDDFGVLLLAMAKRGGGYNDDGALGWEWFELTLDDEARPVIVWRGQEPPDGECYGCIPGIESMIEPTSCNDCHAEAVEQDHVYTSALWH